MFNSSLSNLGTVSATATAASAVAATANARQYHMRQVTATIPDSRDAVRGWRSGLREALGEATADCFAFLGNGAASHRELFETLSSPTLNPYASWFAEHLQSLPTPDSYSCGPAIETMRTNIQTVLSMYKTTLIKTFEADAELQEAVHALAAGAATHETIRNMYETSEIEEKYKTYCKLYGICMALRSILHPLHEVTRGDARTCSTCLGTADQFVALVPCGHVVCNGCAQQSACYICHCDVEHTVQLQFS
jgi:hypothetical protein